MKEIKKWTTEERDRVMSVFAWLLKQDKKQNPHLYKKIKPKKKGY